MDYLGFTRALLGHAVALSHAHEVAYPHMCGMTVSGG